MGLGMGHGCPEELEKIKERERQRMIRQIDPHFIFNTLGAIRIATKTNADLAYDMVYDFSKYLRAVFHAMVHTESILFKEEVAHIISYMNLEKLRFGENITLHVDIQAENFKLPPFSVQPLIDNAVRHGLEKGKREGVVVLRSYQTLMEYVVEVEDNGAGFNVADYICLPADDGPEAGGLQRVRWQMENMADGSMEISSLIGSGTVVVLRIPREQK